MHFIHRSDTPDTLYRHCKDTLKHSQDTQNTPLKFLRDIIQILEDVGPFSLLEKDGLRVGGWVAGGFFRIMPHCGSILQVRLGIGGR